MVVLIALTEEVHVFISHTEYTQDLFVVRPDVFYGVWRRHMFADDVLSLIHSIMRRPYYLSAGLFCQNAPLPGFFICFFLHSVFSCCHVILVLHSMEYKDGPF